MQDETAQIPPGVDPAVASSARVYSYLLSPQMGTYFDVDKHAADQVLKVVYEARDIAQNNRIFVRRAVRWLVGHCGVTQLVDFGSGLPTDDNTHEVARAVDPNVKVVYIDNDATTKLHADHLLADTEGVACIDADVTDTSAVLNDPTMRDMIDFARPVGLIMASLTHLIPDVQDPYGMIVRYLSRVAPGSYLVLSQLTSDGQEADKVRAWVALGEAVNEPASLRTTRDIERFFGGLELVPPYEGSEAGGLAWSNQWGSKEPSLADSTGSWMLAGVGRKN